MPCRPTHSFSPDNDSIDLRRSPGVIGTVSCSVSSGGDGVVYTLGSASATVAVVSGDSSPDRDSSSDRDSLLGLPGVSITASDASVDSGANAVFRVTTSSVLAQKVRVQYSCATSTDGVVPKNSVHLGGHTVEIPKGADTVDISRSDYCRKVRICSVCVS